MGVVFDIIGCSVAMHLNELLGIAQMPHMLRTMFLVLPERFSCFGVGSLTEYAFEIASLDL